jgi:7-cyano-7-deazaguanine synthase in queuosine biosynthesis
MSKINFWSGMSKIVIWSGGADSTLILCSWAEHWKRKKYADPIVALTVSHHSLCNREQFKCQAKAQKEFKKFAKSKGWNIKYKTVRVGGTAKNTGRQAFLWASQLMPYFMDGDYVGWGYTASDTGFWHYSNEFIEFLKAGNSYRKINVEHTFPVEYLNKLDVVKGLRKYKVPPSCIWTCDAPRNGKPCGSCKKCIELFYACKELRAKKGRPKRPAGNFERFLTW